MKLDTTECINLQSLDCLALSGCLRLKNFPHISTNISELHLDGTGLQDIPSWIEKFSRLQFLFMGKCNNIQNVSLNISKLHNLAIVDFSDCKALAEASWNDHPKVSFNFMNCFKLDQEALLQRELVFKQLILPGGKVPSYFTHQTTGTSLSNIPLCYTSLSQPLFRFRACLVVDVGPVPAFRIPLVDIKVCCRFRDRLGNHFDSVDQTPRKSTSHLGIHMVIFDCCFPLKNENGSLDGNYYHVDIQFRLTCFYTCKIKGCGIRITEDCPSSNNQPTNQNALALIKLDSNRGHETDHDEESRRRKRMRVISIWLLMVLVSISKRTLLCIIDY